MSDLIVVKGKIMIDTNDIQDLRGLEYVGEPEDSLTGKYVVRVFSKTPFIDFVCESLPEAKALYKNILKSRHIVDINEMRYGK